MFYMSKQGTEINLTIYIQRSFFSDSDVPAAVVLTGDQDQLRVLQHWAK